MCEVSLRDVLQSTWLNLLLDVIWSLDPIVPTTTPPLVWPSNGQNKGAPTKILNPTPMEGFDII